MKVAVSWSGGKESGLAFYRAMSEGYEISLLVTFIWETPMFHHPLELVELQSKAINVLHVKVKVGQPYFEGYREAIKNLVKVYGVEGIVTGDVAVTDEYHGDWMGSVCKGLDVELIRPLWNLDRHAILKEIVSKGFKSIFTCVKKPWFNGSWLGRILDDACINELKSLERNFGMDLCGERGEYHTILIDGPMFNKVIEISMFRKMQQNSVFYLRPIKFSLKQKLNEVHDLQRFGRKSK